MSDPIRIPLIEDVEPRLANSNKDGLASNVFYDKTKNGTIYANKRPGLSLDLTGSGLAEGLYGGFAFVSPAIQWTDVIWNGTIFCSISQFGATAPSGLNPLSTTSEDGISWVQGFMPLDVPWNRVDWDGTVFCAVGNDASTGYAATSLDGKTWTVRNIDSTKLWLGIASDGVGRFVAVAGNFAATQQASYSTNNGVTWSLGNLGVGVWRDVAWNSSAGVFCAIDALDPTKVSTSPTGATWTNRTIASGDRYSICSNGTLFLTANGGGSGSNKVYTSPDGITWTERTLPASRNWVDCEWTGSHFIVFGTTTGQGYVAYSTDSITWNETLLPALRNDVTDLEATSWNCSGGNTNAIVSLSNGSRAYQYAYSQDDGSSYVLGDLNTYFPFPVLAY